MGTVCSAFLGMTPKRLNSKKVYSEMVVFGLCEIILHKGFKTDLCNFPSLLCDSFIMRFFYDRVGLR